MRNECEATSFIVNCAAFSLNNNRIIICMECCVDESIISNNGANTLERHIGMSLLEVHSWNKTAKCSLHLLLMAHSRVDGKGEGQVE
jgi:hypothetical protein